MGHGDHWACILPDTNDAVATFLPRVLHDGEPIEGRKMPFSTLFGEDGGMVEGEFEETPIGLLKDFGAFSALAIIVRDAAGNAMNLWTGFPFLSQGVRVDLKITEINEWEHGLEAEISGETSDGLQITYFDLFYFRDAEKYHVGERVSVELGCLAFDVGKPTNDPILIEDSQRITELRRGMGEDDDDTPIEVGTEGMAILLPIEDWDAYEYQFQGPVKSVRSAHVESAEFSLATVTLMRDREDFDLPILIGQHAKNNVPLEAGKDLSGQLWVHGRLIDSQ